MRAAANGTRDTVKFKDPTRPLKGIPIFTLNRIEEAPL